MRIGAWLVVLIGAASVAFGISNIWQAREGVTAQGRVAIIGVPILLGLVIGGAALVLALGPGTAAVLAGVPARDVAYAGGRLLDSSVVRGVGGAPSYVARFYGTDEPEESVVAGLSARLAALGYRPAVPSPGPLFRPGDGHQLAAFTDGTSMVRLHALAVPRRVGGVIVSGVQRIVVLVVSDDRPAAP